MVDVDVYITSHLKEELAWATDKWLWVISTTMLFKKYQGAKRNKRQYCFALLCGL